MILIIAPTVASKRASTQLIGELGAEVASLKEHIEWLQLQPCSRKVRRLEGVVYSLKTGQTELKQQRQDLQNNHDRLSKALDDAVAHFQARIDFHDAELVLVITAMKRTDPAPTHTTEKIRTHGHSEPIFDFRKRATHLWLTDFDKVNSITLDIPERSRPPKLPRRMIGTHRNLLAGFRRPQMMSCGVMSLPRTIVKSMAKAQGSVASIEWEYEKFLATFGRIGMVYLLKWTLAKLRIMIHW